jgi:hypothetical protein
VTLDEVIPFLIDDELYQIAWDGRPRHAALDGAAEFVRSGQYDHKWPYWREKTFHVEATDMMAKQGIMNPRNIFIYLSCQSNCRLGCPAR